MVHIVAYCGPAGCGLQVLAIVLLFPECVCPSMPECARVCPSVPESDLLLKLIVFVCGRTTYLLFRVSYREGFCSISLILTSADLAFHGDDVSITTIFTYNNTPLNI